MCKGQTDLYDLENNFMFAYAWHYALHYFHVSWCSPCNFMDVTGSKHICRKLSTIFSQISKTPLCTLVFVSIRQSEQVCFYVKFCKGLIKPMFYWLLGLCCACSSENQAGKILWIALNDTERTLNTMIPTSLKHGEGLRICSSMAHLTEACRMLPSYSRELCVPLGVPRERSYPGSLK